MKKGLLVFLAVLLAVPVAFATTHYCNSCESCNANITAAAAGDTIALTADITDYPFNYTNPVCINSSAFNNKTFNCQNHLIDGNDSLNGYGFYLVNNSGNTIKNCRIKDVFIGIFLYSGYPPTSSNNNKIINNVINSSSPATGDGILIYMKCNGNTVDNNTIYSSSTSWGISIWAGTDNKLTNNKLTINSHGIMIGQTSNITLRNNSITKAAGRGGYGLYMGGGSASFSPKDIDTSNTINGKPILFFDGTYKPCPNNQVLGYGSNYSFIAFSNCENITLQNTAATDMILLYNTTDSVVKNSNVSNTYVGFELYRGKKNKLINNIANSDSTGIEVSYSANITVAGNTANFNDMYGIYISTQSPGCIIENNTANSNAGSSYGRGFLLWGVSGARLKNNIANSNNYGFYLISGSSNNTLINNTVNSNSIYDVYMDAGGSGNRIFNMTIAKFYWMQKVNISNFILGTKNTAYVKYSEVSATGNLTTPAETGNNFRHGAGFISINSTAMPYLNKTANVTLAGIDCDNFNLWHTSGFYTSLAAIEANGAIVATQANIGGDCTDNSICKYVKCSDSTLTFEAQHFDGFGSGGLGGGSNASSSSTGNVSINLTSEVSIMVKYNINYGSGRVDPDKTFAVLDSSLTNATNGTWAYNPQYLYVENDGTVNISVNITSSKNASSFIGGTNPELKVKGIVTETDSCKGTFKTTPFEIFTTSQSICSLFQFGTSFDSFNVSTRLLIPSDAPTGHKESVLTFSAKKV